MSRRIPERSATERGRAARVRAPHEARSSSDHAPRMTSLSRRVQAWADRGAAVEFRERRIHKFERGGAQPTLLLLHGFPSSSFDWRGLLDALPEQAAIAFNCLGFGLSEKPRDHDYTLGWQADLAEELVARAGAPQVVLVAHDMGTSVATELLARDIRGETPLNIRGALLFNGSVIVERASLTTGQKLLRSPSRTAVRPADQRAVVPPAVRASVLARASARPRGGRRSVRADRPRRRAAHHGQAHGLHRRAHSARRPLARRLRDLAR